MFDALSVEGEFPLEIPGGRITPAIFKADQSGEVTITFKDVDLVRSMISEALYNRIIHLGFHYVAARPREQESDVRG
jgi:hypothetical protein